MSARDDYPHLATTGAWYVGITTAEREAGEALDEIDRLRAIKKSDDGAYEHVVEIYHEASCALTDALADAADLRLKLFELQAEHDRAVAFIRIQEGITS